MLSVGAWVCRACRPRRLLPAAVAALLLTCYWLTLAPSITERDSGEIATGVHVMGVVHPTGYPLYLMVGKLFDLVPAGEPARRIAFFSAVSVAAAGGLVCWMLMALGGGGAAGLLGGLVAGLNLWVWPQANQAEVYGLNLLLVSLVLVMFVRWQLVLRSEACPPAAGEKPLRSLRRVAQEPGVRRLNQLAFCCGLSLTHHRLALFFAAPALVWAAFATPVASSPAARNRAPSAKARPRLRLLARAAGYAALPLLLYLWLPFRSAFNPPLNWGNTSGSPGFFLDHVLGRMYYFMAFAAGAANAADQLRLLAVRLWLQLGIVGILLALVGAVSMTRSRRERPFGVVLMAGCALVIVWTAFYNVPDRDPFYTPAILVVSTWCGAGLGYAMRAARRLRWGAALPRVVAVAGLAVAVILPVQMLVKNRHGADRSHYYTQRDLAAVALHGIPANGVVLVEGDEANAILLYYTRVIQPRGSPLTLSPTYMLWPWSWPLLPPELREVGMRAWELPRAQWTQRLAFLAYGARERLDPRRPLYTSASLAGPPPGFVLGRDYPFDFMVRPPGIRQAADAPGMGPVLELPQGAGALLGVALPSGARRGQPFAFTAAVRWTGAAQLDGDLVFVFAHASVAQRVMEALARDKPQSALAGMTMLRPTPLLFGLAPPASRPGRHYQQTVSAIFPRAHPPGRYQVMARFEPRMAGAAATSPVALGTISVE